jgi:heavy metal efflux system protein
VIDGWIGWVMRHRPAVLFATLLVAVVGVLSFRDLTIEAFPDPTDTTVNVITNYPGQPAEEIERQVAIPIERAINGLPGLARMRSLNLFGLSFLTLTFRDGFDPFTARAQTIERLRGVELPAGVTPQLGSLSTPIGEIYRYSLAVDPARAQADPLALRTLQDWTVRPKLLQVDGVADVVSYGGLQYEIHVHPDPSALAARGLTLHDMEEALHAASENASGGILERGAERLVIRSKGLFGGIDDIAKVAIATRGGTPILVRDVASVQEGWAPRQGIYSRNLDHDAIEGIVLMRRGENPTQVLERLRKKVAEINRAALPAGVTVSPFYDRTELVDETLKTVFRNLVEGALLVLLVLYVFLLDLRAALIVASLIPLAMVSAFIYLKSRGMAANLLSMGAVDFGIIVDGGVVIIENIVRRMQPASPAEVERSSGERIRQAVLEVARPTLFALLIIIAAYVPIFLLQRVEGRIFAPMAHTVVAALLGGLLFSVTLVPVLATFAYRRPVAHRESPLLRWAGAAYLPLLRSALRRPLVVLSMATAGLVLSLILLGNMGTEFLPELNEGALYLTFTLPDNTSLSEGRRMVPMIDAIIAAFPQVESYSSQLGRPEDGTDATLPNNLEFFVRLRPMATWPGEARTLSALIHEMNQALATVPGLDVNFSQPIRDNVNENISGQFGQIALKIYANDLGQLQSIADRAKAALEQVRGVADLGIVKSGESPQIEIEPRRELLGRFGLSMSEVQAFVSTALGGRAVGTLWLGERSFDIVLRFPEAARETVERISALRVPTRTGALVPLSAICSVALNYGRASVNRENGQRYIGIRMNVRGRDLGGFVKDAQARVAAHLGAPAGVTFEWGGEFESKERAMNRLLLVVPVALLITLLLLFNAFRSFGLAVLVLLNVPFALVGGAVGLWLVEMPFSIAAAVGFIALVGQAALNGVLVIAAIEERRAAGVALERAIVEGASERLRAVLITAALAAFGLMPAALSKAMGAETQRPIAVVIVGGTLSAALLTLVVLPVMYGLWRRRST